MASLINNPAFISMVCTSGLFHISLLIVFMKRVINRPCDPFHLSGMQHMPELKGQSAAGLRVSVWFLAHCSSLENGTHSLKELAQNLRQGLKALDVL